jgi:hypothetical protein
MHAHMHRTGRGPRQGSIGHAFRPTVPRTVLTPIMRTDIQDVGASVVSLRQACKERERERVRHVVMSQSSTSQFGNMEPLLCQCKSAHERRLDESIPRKNCYLALTRSRRAGALLRAKPLVAMTGRSRYVQRHVAESRYVQRHVAESRYVQRHVAESRDVQRHVAESRDVQRHVAESSCLFSTKWKLVSLGDDD